MDAYVHPVLGVRNPLVHFANDVSLPLVNVHLRSRQEVLAGLRKVNAV